MRRRTTRSLVVLTCGPRLQLCIGAAVCGRTAQPQATSLTTLSTRCKTRLPRGNSTQRAKRQSTSLSCCFVLLTVPNRLPPERIPSHHCHFRALRWCECATPRRMRMRRTARIDRRFRSNRNKNWCRWCRVTDMRKRGIEKDSHTRVPIRIRSVYAYLHVRHARQYTAHRAAGCHSSIALWASPGHSLHAALCSTQTSELTAVVCTAQRKLGNCFDSN